MGQLGRAGTEHEMVGSELLVFPPGSCTSLPDPLPQLVLTRTSIIDTKVFKEGTELSPCDVKGMNEWIRGVRPVDSISISTDRPYS